MDGPKHLRGYASASQAEAEAEPPLEIFCSAGKPEAFRYVLRAKPPSEPAAHSRGHRLGGMTDPPAHAGGSDLMIRFDSIITVA